MKRRATWLVEKRDGRREWLRATKLAHSILTAVQTGAGGPSHPNGAPQGDVGGLAMSLARVVVQAVRGAATGPEKVLRAADLAAAVPQVLQAAGFRDAAQCYAAAGKGAVAGPSGDRRSHRISAYSPVHDRADQDVGSQAGSGGAPCA